ncbi:hypothetical protein EN962_16435 [Mesorhizobium sp. M7A.F.Ca.CA.001.09.2.1]|uniref:Uncharacterized protein n=1 Tax=Mesorhizobium ciceri TaxID=39645 RepID=A0AB38TCA5_9HYPH|nr:MULTISPECIES: hypothetical protein [Mesorhizobium]RUY49578.1 hypothetical protein EN981_15770 [Mesorhizobium sp. M7A.F.Ca.CA.001.13.2.1]MDF3215004.1 hypothetical protein [Mesorhizobium ciceri]RUY65615.1 hypothetical protein EN965_18760 [Mesorhizobium sp. M7A.F.Ca.CA.001.05.1.1]RUY73270.1 hypothetical protein EN980_00810 [Mesorhizobium sp. M7A.F.Ca.CA.001.13.1.1]RUY77383.1 hypothetical protein EN962_16435 [Mesorhizobium sp. M7A.F.Ca.CA.001.09.2.1]
MAEEPSERLIEQRIRNRIYEILEILTDCDDGVDLVGIKGYFYLFEDFLHRPSIEAGTSALSKDERAIVLEIAEFLEAASETNPDFTKAEFIDSGWPGKIAPTAREARTLFLRRGLFSEKVEELEPGQPAAITAGR